MEGKLDEEWADPKECTPSTGSSVSWNSGVDTGGRQTGGGPSKLLSKLLRVKTLDALTAPASAWSKGNIFQTNSVPEGARTVSALPTTNGTPLIKLEAISSREMTIVSLLVGFAVMYNVLYLGTVTCFARYRWAQDASCVTSTCQGVLLRPDFRGIVWFNFITCSLFTLVALSFTAHILYLYFCRIENLQRPEVLWSLALTLPTVVLANNPIFNLDRIHVLPSMGGELSRVLVICRYVIVAWSLSAVTLYMALKFGSLERNADLSNITYGPWFYVKRISPVVVLFIGVFVGGMSRRAELSPQPMVPLIALIRSGYLGFRFPLGTIVVSVTTGALQMFFLFFFIARYYIDSRKITQASYREARLKAINVFWLWRHTIVPLLTSMVATAACAAVFPPNLTNLHENKDTRFAENFILDVPYFARSGIVLVYVSWAILECFCSLPSVYRPTFIEKVLIDRLGLPAGTAFAPIATEVCGEGANVPPSSARIALAKQQPVQTGTVLEDTLKLKPVLANTQSSHVEHWLPKGKEEMHEFPSQRMAKGKQNLSAPVVWTVSDPMIRSAQFRFDECVLSYNMSYLVYLTDADIVRGLAELGAGSFSLQHVFREETRDLVAFVAFSAEIIVVAFRGTVSMSNARINMQFGHSRHLPEEDPDWIKAALKSHSHHPQLPPAIHKGFADAYYSLQKGVLEQVRVLCASGSKPRRVLCCGHSLGGALATLCAFDCRVSLDLPDTQVTLVSFGSPRVGNRAFSLRFAVAVSDSWRIVNRDDAVTNLPKRHVGTLAYEHVPRCVLFDVAGNLILDPMYSDLKLFHHGGRVQPHSLISYRASLEAFVDVANIAAVECNEATHSPDWWDFASLGKGSIPVKECEIDFTQASSETMPPQRHGPEASDISVLNAFLQHASEGPNNGTLAPVDRDEEQAKENDQGHDKLPRRRRAQIWNNARVEKSAALLKKGGAAVGDVLRVEQIAPQMRGLDGAEAFLGSQTDKVTQNEET